MRHQYLPQLGVGSCSAPGTCCKSSARLLHCCFIVTTWDMFLHPGYVEVSCKKKINTSWDASLVESWSHDGYHSCIVTKATQYLSLALMASYCTGYYYRREFFDCDMNILPHASFSSNLEWWAMLLSDWNGMSMMASLGRVLPDVAHHI